jgi:hypothetical protein
MGSLFNAFSTSLPIALGIAASPMTILALMILLMTPRALSNAYSFLFGWFIGLFLIGGLVLLSPGLNHYTSGPTPVSGWIRIGLGSLFLLISILIAKDLPKKGKQTTPPKWMEKVDSYGPKQAMSIGLFLSILNFKNAAMVASGAVVIAAAGLSSIQEVILLILFCFIASLGVLFPVVIYLLFRNVVESVFAKMKIWLQKYSTLILMLVLIVFGLWSLYRGIVLVGLYSG